MSKPGAEPAFPICISQGDQRGGYKNVCSAAGMTIRQYFVAQAMNGLLSDSGVDDPEELAKAAVSFSDACIQAEAETREP